METLTPEEKNICAGGLFDTLLEKGIDAVFIVQSDDTIVYANKQAELLFGLSAVEILAVRYSDLFAHDRVVEGMARFQALLNDGKAFDRYESEMASKEKRSIPVEISIFHSACRERAAEVIVVRDLTMHKQMDADIQKNIDRYRELGSIVDQSFEAIMITDLEGVIQYVNASWERLNGWAGEEVVGKVTPRAIKSGAQDASFYEEFWRTLLAGDIVERTVTNKRKDGTLYEAEIIAMPLKNDFGMLTGFAGFQRDVTVRNQIQAQLMQEKKFSEDIIDRVNAIVIVIDAQGIVSRFNQKAEDIIGYTKEDMIGKDLFATIFPRDTYPLLWSEFSYAKGEEGMIKSFENDTVTKAGDVRRIAWSVSQVERGDKTVSIISFGADITDRKKIEADLLEKNKDLERFKDLMVGRELKMMELKKELAVFQHPAAIVYAEKDINQK